MKANTRNALLLALASAGAAYLFFKADSFWRIVSSVLIAVWALIGALPLIDGAWRFRVGLAVCSLLGGFVALWPTLTTWTDGKLPCPAYVRDRVTSAIAPGLDLRGG